MPLQYEIIEEFLKPETCDELIRMANPRFQASTSWNVTTGRPEYSDFRVSEQMYFMNSENMTIAQIENDVHFLVDVPLNYGEGIQVVHYSQGGQFKPHWDAFDPYFAGNQSVLQTGGQRVWTFIMYLNDVDGVEGAEGDTYFPKINLSIKPKKGLGLLFKNINDQGQIEQESFHCGRPVAAGRHKYIATRWIRERPYFANMDASATTATPYVSSNNNSSTPPVAK